MNHFYVWRFKRMRRWIVIGSLAFFTAMFLWVSENGAFSVFMQDEPAAITKGNSEEPNIALTFNISWGEERVYDILEMLEKNKTQATFFVSGEWAERHPSILEEISEGEHELGMLGYRYKSYIDQDIEQVRRDLQSAKEVFEKLGYEDIEILRTPNGHFDDEILQLAKDMNFQVIHWNINPNDWKNPGTQVIVDNIMKNTKNGDIILMHASDSVKQTANALETILPGLKNKGFDFVSVTELVNQAHAESKLVE
ncbi:polysaccharide deacetylase family sporulation protein PdaB [Oceanobacillus halophilus]|uniref:Polysaccharide deacetylase family sporulation protein PdaB n=1 Tax=Oceanobacillus halophilus TaxID=930130 RepID=A0A494ZZU8_9BACI|nr:polysaccharide deacetylase family sporulation protein PdaB [Oceanobacillus halophilus]RKQ32271.1 polysaccharide deacetylase family sporulation protein PdaB [Oceanobacillus halophilus]